MAKFFGVVGYSTGQVESANAPGVWEEGIVEREYYGDLLRNTRQIQDGQKVLDDLTVGNSISIVSDAYALQHFFAIRYVEWARVLWEVREVVVENPRLILRLGGVYNGPTQDRTA